MTAYITKYALTEGILELEVEESSNGYVRWPNPSIPTWSLYASKNQWRKTREEAVILANAMRDKKVATLKKQVARIEALTFDTQPTP